MGYVNRISQKDGGETNKCRSREDTDRKGRVIMRAGRGNMSTLCEESGIPSAITKQPQQKMMAFDVRSRAGVSCAFTAFLEGSVRYLLPQYLNKSGIVWSFSIARRMLILFVVLFWDGFKRDSKKSEGLLNYLNMYFKCLESGE